MSRFRKGTNDHDGDGRKGGSMPAKKATASTPKRTASKAKAATTKAAKAEVEALRVAAASTSDPQSGRVQIVSDDKPSAAAVVRARKEAVDAQFAAAVAKADPAVEDATLSRQIRGY